MNSIRTPVTVKTHEVFKRINDQKSSFNSNVKLG